MTDVSIQGYTLGTGAVPHSPVTLDDFARLKECVLFTEDDAHWLRQSGEILRDHVEEILDVWYGFIASKSYLLEAFSDPATGKPDEAYLAAVRKRFGRWILDTASANFNQAWLDYQYEIARRHHRVGKNRTDGAQAADVVPMRYMLALLYPVTATLEPFLARKGHAATEVQEMREAWTKAVLLQLILWCEPYVDPADF
jgi:Protoglobin